MGWDSLNLTDGHGARRSLGERLTEEFSRGDGWRVVALDASVAKVGRDQTGMSLIEMVVVVGIIGIMTSMAIVQIANSRVALKGDGGMRVVLAQVNGARELAISQRRYMRLNFVAPNLVQVIREDTTLTTTTLYSIVLEGGVTFTIPTMVPLTDTPDGPSNGGVSSANGINFGAVTNVKFAPDGTLVNQDGVTTNHHSPASPAPPSRYTSATPGAVPSRGGTMYVSAAWIVSAAGPSPPSLRTASSSYTPPSVRWRRVESPPQPGNDGHPRAEARARAVLAVRERDPDEAVAQVGLTRGDQGVARVVPVLSADAQQLAVVVAQRRAQAQTFESPEVDPDEAGAAGDADELAVVAAVAEQGTLAVAAENAAEAEPAAAPVPRARKGHPGSHHEHAANECADSPVTYLHLRSPL